MDLLAKSFEYIDTTIELIRQLSKSLIAPSLGEVTLKQAIEELVDTIQMASDLKIGLNTSNYDEQAIDTSIQLMLYRIVQEQTNNIIKHAKAKNVSINLRNTPTQIVMTIEDDGVGFDRKKSSGGIGLRNMADRAEFFNGNFRISSEPSKGCMLEVSIPLKRDASIMQLAKKIV